MSIAEKNRKFCIFIYSDSVDSQVSTVKEHCQSSKVNSTSNLSQHSSALCNDRIIKYSIIRSDLSGLDTNPISDCNQTTDQSIRHQINYSTYLRGDFTLDGTDDRIKHSIAPLPNEIFKYFETISSKLSQNTSNLFVQLAEDELNFIE